jgi:hypothetical protein
VSTDCAGNSRDQSSTVPSPATRYGWAPTPYGAGVVPGFLATTVVRSPEFEQMRVARLADDRGLQNQLVDVVAHHPEIEPGDQAVKSVAPSRLGDAQLFGRSRKRVSAVDHTIGPRRKNRTPIPRADLLGFKGNNEITPGETELAQRCADAADRRRVVAVNQVVAPAGHQGRGGHCCVRSRSLGQSALRMGRGNNSGVADVTEIVSGVY